MSAMVILSNKRAQKESYYDAPSKTLVLKEFHSIARYYCLAIETDDVDLGKLRILFTDNDRADAKVTNQDGYGNVRIGLGHIVGRLTIPRFSCPVKGSYIGWDYVLDAYVYKIQFVS